MFSFSSVTVRDLSGSFWGCDLLISLFIFGFSYQSHTEIIECWFSWFVGLFHFLGISYLAIGGFFFIGLRNDFFLMEFQK